MGLDATSAPAAPRGRVLVAMSGGVDSSVAVHLLQEAGWRCVGATMRLFDDGTPGLGGGRPCGNARDIADARAVAERLGIEHHVLDFRGDFERDVIEDFVSAYERGATPNPCAVCNRRIKFGALLRAARGLGCDRLATGHYARVRRRAGESGPVFELAAAADATKDQSYFLYGLTQEVLAHVLFPLGDLTKEGDVRRIASGLGLEVAGKRDSQGICFVPGNDFASFIERRRGEALPAGDILDTAGRVLGRHRGALRYTIGQRKGLGVAAARPLYVCATDTRANTVTLGGEEDLMAGALEAVDWVWSAPADAMEGLLAAGPVRVAAKIRYHQPDQAARISRADAETMRVDFDEPQRAIAPGQAVVAYRDGVVLGGGTVARAL